MRFGPVAVNEAAGGILAHSLKGPEFAFKKGRRLTGDDAQALAAAGYASVVVAVFEPGDLGEDDVALAVARAIAGDGLVVAEPLTGRCNVFAEGRGLAVIDADAVHRVNAVDEAITVATVPEYAIADAGQMVATVKVIPFAVPEAAVAAAIGAAGGAVMRIAALRPRRLGLVQTRLPGTKLSVLEKTAETTRARIAGLGSELADSVVVDHDAATVARAIDAYREAGLGPILVLGASAIVDRRDVVPSAIAAAGGAVRHLGMPVDPGNLLLLAEIGETPVLGLPGCARSPRLNGFDWVLSRLLADLPVGGNDVMRMGVGGLLGEIELRPQPRKPTRQETHDRTAEIAAVVLAAGRSERMGTANKLLEPIDGQPMVAHAVDAALQSRASTTIVVVGHDADRIQAALGDRPVSFVVNTAHADGLATSIRAGLEAVPPAAVGAVILLADTPSVRARHVDRLIAAFDLAAGRAVCVPTHRGRRGNPVLWAARFFGELGALQGAAGGRTLLRRHADAVCEVEMDDTAVLTDIDTPTDLATARAAAGAADR